MNLKKVYSTPSERIKIKKCEAWQSQMVIHTLIVYYTHMWFLKVKLVSKPLRYIFNLIYCLNYNWTNVERMLILE